MSKNTGNSAVMKQNNQKAILYALSYNTLSRADLARLLGLTRTSLSLHIDELLNQGLVQELGAGESTDRGRKPVMLDINPDYGYIGGIYLSREHCSVGITDMKGRILSSEETNIKSFSSPESASNKILEDWNSVVNSMNISVDKIIGLGISVPGPVDTLNGLILKPPDFEMWWHFPIAEYFNSRTGKSVIVENDANSLTLAEMRLGAGMKHNNFIFILVESNIGGGIVINGQLYQGVGGFSSEFGHCSIALDGRLCSCGNIGCLERYACIPALLMDSFSPEEQINSWKQVVDRAESGDIRCIKVIEREAEYISAVIINSINTLELEAVVLGGDLQYKPQLIISYIKNNVGRRMFTRDNRSLEILPSFLPAEAKVVAAGAIVISNFFLK